MVATTLRKLPFYSAKPQGVQGPWRRAQGNDLKSKFPKPQANQACNAWASDTAWTSPCIERQSIIWHQVPLDSHMTAVLRDLSNHPHCFALAAINVQETATSNENYAGEKNSTRTATESWILGSFFSLFTSQCNRDTDVGSKSNRHLKSHPMKFLWLLGLFVYHNVKLMLLTCVTKIILVFHFKQCISAINRATFLNHLKNFTVI